MSKKNKDPLEKMFALENPDELDISLVFKEMLKFDEKRKTRKPLIDLSKWENKDE